MKIWLVVLFLGKNVLVAGPMPGMIECLNWKQQHQAGIDSAFLTGRMNEAPLFEGKRLAREDITIQCWVLRERPKIYEEGLRSL